MTLFRGGATDLRIETGRWEDVLVRGMGYKRRLERHQRLCKSCFGEPGDERHVLLRCPTHRDGRNALVQLFCGGSREARATVEAIRGDCYQRGGGPGRRKMRYCGGYMKAQQATMRFLREAMDVRSRVLGAG